MNSIIKIPLCVIFFLSVFQLHAQNSLKISGSIDKKLDHQILVLDRVYPFRSTLPGYTSESIIKDGRFFFSLPAAGFEQYTIRFKDDSKQNILANLMLQPKQTTITFLDTSLTKYQIIGNDVDSIQRISINPLTDGKTYAPFEITKLVTAWVENHPDSELNTYTIYNSLLNNKSDEEILRLFKLIPESNRKGTYFDELKYVSDSLFIGKTLPDFIQTDTSGVEIKLLEFRGKYVLVDFWASWCIPCRAENPHLVTAIQKYPNKDFEIISVSLDDKAAPWMAAIKKDRIQMWKHTSDLKGWNNKVAIKHRIRSVPANFLVDPTGKIIAKNLRGKEVLDVLEKIIPKP